MYPQNYNYYPQQTQQQNPQLNYQQAFLRQAPM